MLNKLFSNIFWLTFLLALFLDAINVDALFTSHAMIREEYEGQSSETFVSNSDGKVIMHASSGTQGKDTYQLTNDSTQHIFLIDEDSVSLPAQPTITEEVALFLYRSSRIRHTSLHFPIFDFYSLCKLQI